MLTSLECKRVSQCFSACFFQFDCLAFTSSTTRDLVSRQDATDRLAVLRGTTARRSSGLLRPCLIGELKKTLDLFREEVSIVSRIFYKFPVCDGAVSSDSLSRLLIFRWLVLDFSRRRIRGNMFAPSRKSFLFPSWTMGPAKEWLCDIHQQSSHRLRDADEMQKSKTIHSAITSWRFNCLGWRL